MTGCANAEQSKSVGDGGFSLPLVQRVCLVCSEATQHPFLTHNRDTSVMDKVCFLRSESVQRDSHARERRALLYSYVRIPPPPPLYPCLRNYESRNTVMRDKMSDAKVHVTDEQP